MIDDYLIAKSKVPNERQDICLACQGSCCRGMPGANIPQDFQSLEGLFEALKAKTHAIYSRNGLLHVRPASEPWEPVIELISGPRVCKFSSEKGCALAFLDRPFICRSLIPNKVFCHFYGGMTINDVMELVYQQWEKVQKELKIFVEKLNS
jgi:hypothetical protein